MDTLQQLITEIPTRHNLVSQIMFLGVVQGFFIAMVLLIRSQKRGTAFFLGLTFLFQSLVFFDNYLCYTGLMKYTIAFNDSTETLVLLIAPTFYLFLYSLIHRKSLRFKKTWFHFLIPVVYGLTQIQYYLAPLEVKYNAYLGAYHSNLPFAKVSKHFDHSYHWTKNEFHEIVLFTFLFYAILGAKLIWEERHRIQLMPKETNTNRYFFTRNSVLMLIFTFLLAFFVFFTYDDDSGDHYISLTQTVIVYFTTYVLLVESRFFENSWFADKYETSSNNALDFSLVENAVLLNNYFLRPEISLKSLAESLNIGKNTLSKAINLNSGMNFNDYINQKRVNEAKIRLLNKDFAHLTIEAIGNSVGFNSKSAFYTAFKKHAKTSPSAFVKGNKG